MSFALIYALSALSHSSFAATEELQEITVLGDLNRTSAQDFVPSVSALSGQKLERKKQSTLGETLSREAGVSSSYFGPNAARPIIRGQDGERIRVLQNGVGTIDASGTSPDHAVPVDPFLIEKLEIVRGPSALLYGSSAIGGVVNITDGRIAERLLDESQFRFQSQFSSVDSGRSFGLLTNQRAGNWMLHADGVIRASSDYRVPGFAHSQNLRESAPETDEPFKKVPNSSNRSQTGALGVSRVFDQGYLGVSYSNFHNRYGTVAEPTVSIDMNRHNLGLAGEIRDLGFLQSVRLKSTGVIYRHQEYEDLEVGTTFRNRGVESRVDFKHRPVGILDGLFGIQHQQSQFSAAGEEAFLPTTKNGAISFFAYEEAKLGDFTPSAGARFENSSVRSIDSDLFGAGQRRGFWSSSGSLGLLYQFHPEWSVALNTAYTERAPNYQELFANGVHVATDLYETGSTSLQKERSKSLEWSLRKKGRASEGRLSLFVQDYDRYIALAPTGAVDADSGLDMYEYRAIQARLFGGEFEWRQELPKILSQGVFEVDFKADFVRGQDRSASSSLPRMTPIRETIGLNYRLNGYFTELEWQHTHDQTFLAQNESRTKGFHWLNWSAEAPLETSFGAFRLIGKVQNIFNVESRSHVSFLKDKAPLPGRNFIVGIQASI